MKYWAKQEKCEKVKAARGASQLDVFYNGELLDTKKHPKHEHQALLLFWYESYVWVIPLNKKTGELITTFRSSKWKKRMGL